MSPKKKPDPPEISHIEVESEIAELAGENSKTEDQTWSAIRSMFSDFFHQSDLRQNKFLSSLSDTVKQSNQSLLSAINQVASKNPQPPLDKACPSRVSLTPKGSGLLSASPNEDEDERQWEEMEDYSSDEDMEFEGFGSIPPSG